MKRLLFSILLAFTILTVFGVQTKDEIRKVDGKDYRVYTVQKGDTWYAIARKFEISYAELRVANKGVDDKLVTGKELLIPQKLNPNDPYFRKNKLDAPVKETPKSDAASGKFHVVQASQTLYSISKMYGVTVDQIKTWNDLKSNEISVGQKLIVAKKPEGEEPVKESISTPPPVKEPVVEKTEEEIPVKNETTEVKTESKPAVVNEHSKQAEAKDDEKIDTSQITSQVEDMPPPANDTKLPDEPVANPKSSKDPGAEDVVFGNGRQQVNETGSAVVIDDNENTSEKYYALHKTAKIGTVIRVMNLANSKKTYVKVIGQMTDDSENGSTLIKISRASAEKLGITEKTARVNLLYGIGGD